MTFSFDWELSYATGNAVVGTYPNFEKLVGVFVREAERMLELGVGAGGEIPFFASMGFGYHGIDGSQSAIDRARQRFSLGERVKVADFTKEIPFEGQFDFICDRASIAHNDTESIKRCLALVHKALKPGGILLCSDWFSTRHSEFTRGRQLDGKTRDGYEDGQFKGAGVVHFCDERDLIELFTDFEGIFVQERGARRPAPNALVERPLSLRWVSDDFRLDEYRSAWWDVVVRKPE